MFNDINNNNNELEPEDDFFLDFNDDSFDTLWEDACHEVKSPTKNIKLPHISSLSSLQQQVVRSSLSSNQKKQTTSLKHQVYRRGLKIDLSSFAKNILFTVHQDKLQLNKIKMYLEFLTLKMYGKRNIRKDSVNENELDTEDKEIYRLIRKQLQHPVRRKRVFCFINQTNITKRLINYFVVHYSLIERELSYYLDKRKYPCQIIGQFNEPNQPEILNLIEQGANIVWINFHQEYKNSKNKNGRKNRHAPYRRSVSVRGNDGMDYSLCELNFYLWLDEVGGFELFYRFEEDIRKKKQQYDEKKRKSEHLNTTHPKKRKRKTVLKETDGKNYKTHIVHVKKSAPFCCLQTNTTLNEFIQSTRKRRRLAMVKDFEEEDTRKQLRQQKKKRKKKRQRRLNVQLN